MYERLSIPQQNIWNMQKYYENTAISNQCGAIFYNEKRNEEKLKKSIYTVIQNQTGFRLQFKEDKEIYQYVNENSNAEIPCLNFEDEEIFDRYAERFASVPIALTDGTMYRFVVFTMGEKSGILVVLSHLISDAWTFGILAKEVDKAYRMLSGDNTITFMKVDYLDFVKSEQKYIESDRYKKDEAYWLKKYTVKPEKTPIKLFQLSSESIEAKRFVKILPEYIEKKITSFCDNESVTPAVLFETAIMAYLYRINSENTSITIGIPVLNRSNARERTIAGMFISTMPLTITFDKNYTVIEIAKLISKEHMEIFRHQKYPYSSILEKLRKEQNFAGNLYDVMFSYQNATTDVSAKTKWYSNGYSEVPFTVHVDNRDGMNTHTMTIDYQTHSFNQSEIELIVGRFVSIIEQIVDEPNSSVDTISIMAEEEKKKVLYEFNDTYMEYPRDMCVHELFEERVKKTADKIALIFEEKEFTYRQLDEMSNSLAHYLRDKGVKPNDVVPIIAKRSWYIIVAMLSVLKAGAAYICIDYHYPIERINYLLSECDATLILTLGISLDKSVSLDTINYGENVEALTGVNTSENLFCVIHTSGSTGKPKVAALTHRNIMNYIAYSTVLFENTEQAIATTIITFDAFVQETIVALCNSIPIILLNEDEMTKQTEFEKVVSKYENSFLFQTPTKIKNYIQNSENCHFLDHISSLVLGGEVLPQELCDFVYNKNSNCNIFNIYGPTETTICCDVKRIDSLLPITIGGPIANAQTYILDKKNTICPIGIPGELCVAGDGVGAGYLNRPELTAEKFVANPFAAEDNCHGKIMYHTGDLARWRSDGEIEFLGRIDTQVKIRGLRIELGEIESVMNNFEGIQLAAVADKRDKNGRQYLVGYYVTDFEVNEKSLRHYLSTKLPKYMIPNYFMRLVEMPMTASGKIARKKLPSPDFTVINIKYVAPETAQGSILCQLSEQILQMEKIGVDDDFFECGGDSLRAIEYVAKAHNKGIDFSLQNVFDYPTVRELCAHINGVQTHKFNYNKQDFDKYAFIFEKNVQKEIYNPREKPLGDVVLTGATGFVGIHILDCLMRKRTGKIYCIVREKEGQSAECRLRRTLKYYFGEQYETEIHKHIIPVAGDVEKKMPYELPVKVQTVIHAAASVKHYGAYHYFHQINVEGTQHVINYAKSANARMIHISTLSVSGNSLADKFAEYKSCDEKNFDERSFYIEQPLDNVYIHSKFEAEKRVYDAILEGLDAKVIRVGNLTNRVADYKFQPNYKENAFLTRMKAILQFGIFPDYLLPLYIEFSPIDLTAEGIVKIAQYADQQTVFHLNSNRVVCFGRFLEVVEQLGIPMKVVDGEQFNEEMQKTINSADTEYIFEAFQNDMDENGYLVYDSNIRIQNEFTLWFLEKTGFTWNETDYEYLKGYIGYFRNIGYLEV